MSTDEGKDGKDGKDGKEGKEDGNGNKEGSVLGAASAQARTAQAGTAAVLAAVPQKKLPVDEEAEARQKAKHTGHIYVRYTCIKERGCVPVCGVQSDVVESSRLVIPVTLTLSRACTTHQQHTHGGADFHRWRRANGFLGTTAGAGHE